MPERARVTLGGGFFTPQAGVTIADILFATWLYEKTAQRLATPIDFERVVTAAGKTPLRLNKKVLCLEASKL